MLTIRERFEEVKEALLLQGATIAEAEMKAAREVRPETTAGEWDRAFSDYPKIPACPNVEKKVIMRMVPMAKGRGKARVRQRVVIDDRYARENWVQKLTYKHFVRNYHADRP